jgi:hypothetical protein
MIDYVTLEISKPVQRNLTLVKNKDNMSKILEYVTVLNLK